MGHEQYNHYLTVGRLTAEDEGRYQCEARDRHSREPVYRAVRLLIPSLQLVLRVTPALASLRHVSCHRVLALRHWEMCGVTSELGM